MLYSVRESREKEVQDQEITSQTEKRHQRNRARAGCTSAAPFPRCQRKQGSGESANPALQPGLDSSTGPLKSLQEISSPLPFLLKPLPSCREAGKGQAGLGNGVSPSTPRRGREDMLLLPISCCWPSLVGLDAGLGLCLVSW